MSLVVNHNLMAANVARNLNAHYGNLSTSTQRLSSGLRINSAADDAAGLAIRELQRADVAALHQGARNVNDAISLIQVADGALQIIDEKLIRMKELAEQASTGTYDSTQRLMIESEYQAMASEITRISIATDFNGIHLLDGTLQGEHNGAGLDATGRMKIHFGTSNDSAEDYYYIEIPEATSAAFGVGNTSTWEDSIDRIEKKYLIRLQNQLDILNENKYIDQTIKDAINTTATNWKVDFRNALESYIPPTDSIASKFSSYDEVKALGTFPTDYANQSSAVHQRWEYAIGHAVFDSLDFYDKISTPNTGDLTVTFNAGGTITISDSSGQSITSTSNNTVTDSSSNIYSYDENGRITDVTIYPNNYIFERNVESGELTHTVGTGDKITYDQNGLVDSVLNTDESVTEFTHLGDSDYAVPTKVKAPDGTEYSFDPKDTNKIQEVSISDGNRVSFGSEIDINIWTPSTSPSGTLHPDSYVFNNTAVYPNIKIENGGKTYTESISHNVAGVKAVGDDFITKNNINEYTFASSFTGVFDLLGNSVSSGQLTFHDESMLIADDGTNTIQFDSNGKVTKIIDQLPVSTLNNYPNTSTSKILSVNDDQYVYEFNGINYYFSISSLSTNSFTSIVDEYGNNLNPNSVGTVINDISGLINKIGAAEAGYTGIQKSLLINNSFHALNIAQNSTALANQDPRFTDAQKCAYYIDQNKMSVQMDCAIRNTVSSCVQPTVLDPNHYTYAGLTICTQQDAQMALRAINQSIVTKDKIRADLGALQNRFENTISNLNTMAENLQASESRISDVDVATEMTEFVRQQILTQAAVAMLAQANSLPQMAMQLIGG